MLGIRRFPLSLVVALGVYFGLAAGTVREVGIVGEVAPSWALGRPPAVLVSVEPPRWADGSAPAGTGHVWGPFVASQVRPVEGLRVGDLSLPIAVNLHTGGVADWPARAIWVLTRSTRAVTAFVVLIGAAVIVAVHRFLRLHGTDVAAAAGALFLATDWAFLFYKKALGATEVLLQAGAIVCLWALWDRRWSGGRLGLVAFAVGAGIGLGAKLSFAATLGALALAALAMRWDRPVLRAPLPRRPWLPLLVFATLLSPLVLAWVHHAVAVPADPHVVSHDFPGVQWSRLVSLPSLAGGRAPARETLDNLATWAFDPLSFFHRAYGADSPSSWDPLRVAGWAIVLAGAALGWRDRHPTPHEALARFASVLLPLQVALLWLVGRDLHHLAQAAPIQAVLVGLSLDALASVSTPPRSFARARMAFVALVPWIAAGSMALVETDRVLATISVPTFTEHGQREIVAMLRANEVRRLVACDYELTGVLEIAAPEIEVEHAWGAASLGGKDRLAPELLRRARGGHFIVVRASAPMIYNLAPSEEDVVDAAQSAGVTAHRVATIAGASLYAVE